MSSTSASTTATTSKKCRIAEIVQYSCDQEYSADGRPQYHCWPIPRIFRICPGRSAVEITRYVNVDTNSGEIKLPSDTSQVLPRGKPWRDVKTYDGATIVKDD